MIFRPFGALAAATAAMAIFALAPAASAATPGAHQVTGAKLGTALVPASAFGRGYQASARISSGNVLEQPRAFHNIATLSCGSFWAIFGTIGLGETATAMDFVNNSRTVAGYQQSVYQFPSARAASSLYKAAYAKYGKCRSMTITNNHSRLFVKLRSESKTRVKGLSAFQVTQTETFSDVTGVTLYSFTLFVVDGDDAFIVDATLPAAGPPRSPSETSVITRLISRVSALG